MTPQRARVVGRAGGKGAGQRVEESARRGGNAAGRAARTDGVVAGEASEAADVGNAAVDSAGVGGAPRPGWCHGRRCVGSGAAAGSGLEWS